MKVLVVGSGIMGIGIAQTCALDGHTVVVNDLNDEILAGAKKNLERQLGNLAESELVAKDKAAAALTRISYSADLEKSASEADIVFEAIPEKLDLKDALLKRLEAASSPETIFATNTSGISINLLAKSLKKKDRLVGTHFFNPAVLIPLVEVVRADETSDKVVDTVMDLLAKAGKKPVKVARDVPGFIGNRLQQALARESMSLVQKGIATPEDIDEVVKSSLALRLLFTGPMEQRDFNGLDTHLSVAAYLYKDLENTEEPLQILVDKVAEGKCGLKTGEGFFDWRNKSIDAVKAQSEQNLIDLLKFLRQRQ